MRPILFFLTCFLICISCENSISNSSTLVKYIPRKAAVIIKTNDLQGLQSDLTNNDFIQSFNETAAFQTIAAQNTLLTHLKPKGETLICFTKLGGTDYEVSLITKLHSNLIAEDSLQASTKSIKKLDPDASYAYLIKDDILIASTSTLLLENIEREERLEENEDLLFKNAYQSASGNAAATLLINGKEGKEIYQDLFPNASRNVLQNSFSWAAIDIDLDTNDVRSSGVLLAADDPELSFNLLRATTPKANRTPEIAPTSMASLTAITYRDWQVFKENKAAQLKVDASVFKLEEEALFATFDEVGTIQLSDEEVIIAVSNDILATEEALAGSNFKTSFRDIEIYEYAYNNAFAKAYEPLLNLPNVAMYAVVDDFYVFAKNIQALETIIANYQNKATLAKSAVFKNTSNQLSDASSYLYIESLDSGYYKSRASKEGKKALQDIELSSYQYAAHQLIQESDYMLLNGLILKNDITEEGGVAQIANVKLSADLLSPPRLVRNHRTNGMDIVTQDVNNVLYLISNAGKVLWQKDLDVPILGDVQQVDLYRNGRLQLAFTTPSSFYILDRNGKEVTPFALSFKDKITQPLAVFDYDNNRKYRFVIVQDEQLTMYDRDGKIVQGFGFTKAGGSVLYPPKHIRIANKDYITIAENTGKLNILSRTGKSRIDLTKNIDFGNTPIFKNGNSFETYDVNGDRIVISTSGKLTQSISDYSSDSKITVHSKLKVGQRENELIINSKKQEIAYGTYTKPSIATIKSKSYISLTNTESSEVYIYDGKGALLPNFPVYGISPASIGFLERNKTLGFVTQGSANSVLIYKIN